MKLLNRFNYPVCVVRAAQASLYRPVESLIRVTSLIGPPAIRQYQLLHWDDIVVDVDDFMQTGFGTAWHQYLSKFADETGYYAEQTLQMEHDGLIVQGTPDLRTASKRIDDYKVTSAWSFVFGKPEWEQQLNTYALLAHANGFPIDSLNIHAFLKDWSELNYMRYRPDYPERPFYHVELPLWSTEQQKAFVTKRIADHKAGMRPCTSEERWQKPTTWAVMKPDAKKATRVLDTEQEAKDWMAANTRHSEGFHIVCRPGGCRRCEDYCIVRSICEFKL